MCLVIVKGTNKRIAKADVLVYKYLDCHYNVYYYTPFQKFPIHFENGKCVMKTPHFTYKHDGSTTLVKEGIHSYYKKSYAENVELKYSYYCFRTIMYYAIIPKGAKYYIGNDGEVVSTELIIFKTKEEYKKHVINSEKICIIEEKSLSLQEI